MRSRHAGPINAALWGPAEYFGGPPGWLIAEGMVVGLVGAAAVAGPGVAGVLAGSPALQTGEAGVLVALGLAIFLVAIGAGRALIGTVAVLGASLALLTPRASAEAVLIWGGKVQSVVVTSIATRDEGASGGRRYCAVRQADGTPIAVRIWRGCEATTGPGDLIGMVYDPQGRVPPRGLEASDGSVQPLTETAGVALGLVAACVVAVVRSYRLTSDTWPACSRGVTRSV